MAKNKRQQRTKPANQPRIPVARVVDDTPVASPPSEQPAFWFGFEVSWAKVVTARVVLFGLLALDAVIAVRHAPRYGAGDFNVANLGFLDAYGPGRGSYAVCQLIISLLLTAAAFGVATRVVLPVATVIYAWLYFGSQLDSYQHHYLVALVLAISCFVPWQFKSEVVRSWALRLLLVQLGIMYLWAAISKLDPVWLDGTTLSNQITGGMRSMIEGTIGFKVAAYLVIAVELVLAGTVWLKPAWKFAAPLGLAFHLGIVATGFEIGLFAYVMCALYILVVPDRIWRSAAQIGLFERAGRVARTVANVPQLALGTAVLVGVPIVLFCRLPYTLPIAFVAVGVALLVARHARANVPIAVLAGILLWTAVDHSTTVAIDYYRFWGGSQRRMGEQAQAEQAYRGMLRIEPDSEIAHFYLGRILIANGNAEEGVGHLHLAQRAEPGRSRAFIEEARYLLGQGKRAEAIGKATDAVRADGSDGEAKAFLETLRRGAKPTPITDDDR